MAASAAKASKREGDPGKPYVLPKDAPDGARAALPTARRARPRSTTRGSRRRRSCPTPSAALLARAVPLQAQRRRSAGVRAARRRRSRRRAPATLKARSRRRRRRCCRRPRTTGQGAAGAALHAARRGAAGARAQRDLLAADGRGDIADRCRGDDAGEADARRRRASGGGSGRGRILFDPDPRFPRQRRTRSRSRAGTEVGDGGVLDKAPPKFASRRRRRRSSARTQQTRRSARRADVLLFDQKIDPQAVLAKLRSPPPRAGTASRSRCAGSASRDRTRTSSSPRSPRPPRRASSDGRWLAFRARRSSAVDSAITITVPAGTPSAEGPNPTRDVQTYSFSTYAPLRVEDAECRRSARRIARCGSGSTTRSTGRDRRSLGHGDAGDPGGARDPQGPLVEVLGPTKPRTTYKVTIGKALKDEFGQLLGKRGVAHLQDGRRVSEVLRPERRRRARSGRHEADARLLLDELRRR